ncbi:MAG TPA: PP2C family serine/threonine-protein phosphatase, partial [Chroococcidiopsis sp.]
AYWITRWGCHQVTLDDDVASREVRMGYGIYREALRHPGSGSLVQALGMSASSMLHPTVQRFILDEDGVFLLCTDGLSDNDRIDECWEAEILPLLDGKTDVASVSQRLIAIANSRNGHDNVTVGLLHIQVNGAAMTPTEALAFAQQAQTEVAAAPSPAPSGTPITAPPPDDPDLPRRDTLNLSPPSGTQLLPAQGSKPPSLLGTVLGILLLLGMAGVLGYLLVPSLRGLVDPLIGLAPVPSPSQPTPSVAPSGSSRSLNAPSLVQLRTADATAGASNVDLVLAIAPPAAQSAPVSPTPVSPNPASPSPVSPTPPAPIAIAGVLPLGSTAIVRQKLRVANEFWVELQVCQGNAASLSPVSPAPDVPSTGAPPSPSLAPAPAPTGKPPSFRALQAGDSGWIREAEITPFVVSNTPADRLSAAQRSACGDIPSTNPTLSGTEISGLGDRRWL